MQDDPLAWRRPRHAVLLVLRGATARTCVPVAVVVGTVLTAVNQGALVVQGRLHLVDLARVAANYVVPYLVSSYGLLSRSRR